MAQEGKLTMAKYFLSLDDPELIAMLKDGAIGVVPTDTVYGLVGRAESSKAVARMYSVKSRERQPGTTIAASTEQLQSLGFPSESLAVASKYWPNALSVEMSASKIAEYLSTGQPVMAARVPNNPEIIALLTQVGPLMTTSANAPKQPTSTSVDMAVDYFGDDVDFYVDGGDLSGRPPSTIIGINDDESITVYRQGAVDIKQ